MRRTIEMKVDRLITEGTMTKDVSIHSFLVNEVEFTKHIINKNTVRYIPRTDEDRDAMIFNPCIILEDAMNTYGGYWDQDEFDPFIVRRAKQSESLQDL